MCRQRLGKRTVQPWHYQARVDFDSSLGADFAPATMTAGGTISLPVTVKNAGSGFTFNACAGATTNCYKVGYRWFDSMAGELAAATSWRPTIDETSRGAR